jgi:hypothetical protein
MVKSIKRGDGWARAEVVDETGSAGIFTDEKTLIEPGNLYVFLVANNSDRPVAPVADVVEYKESTFIDFLVRKGLQGRATADGEGGFVQDPQDEGRKANGKRGRGRREQGI